MPNTPASRRRLQGWLMRIAAFSLVPGVVLVACGSAPQRSIQTRASLPTSVTVSAIVSGNGVGWILDTGGHLWRVSRDGTATAFPAPDARARQAPVATSFGDLVLVGGVRCNRPQRSGSTCPETVDEVTAYADGVKQWSMIVWRRPGPVGDAEGFVFVGPYKGSMLVDTNGGLRGLSSKGDIAFEAPTTPGETCVIGTDLYAVGPANRPSSMPGAPGVATSPQATTVEVEQFNGGRWVPVPGSEHEYTSGGGCAAGAFVIENAKGAAQALWRPTTGWKAVQATEPSDSVGEPVRTSAHNQYRLETSGAVVRLAPTGESQTTGLSFPNASASTSGPPPQLAIDDSGSVIFACVQAPTVPRVCKVAEK